MQRILIDSGPLIALFDASDKYHQASVNFIRANKSRLVTTLASVTETLHMLDFNRQAQLDFLEWLHKGAVEVQNIGNSDFGRIRELTAKYQDLPMDFADSCLVYLAEKLGLDAVATVDRDFSVYRINGRKKFKMVLS
jgi:predicted nucleic acid-binding protein